MEALHLPMHVVDSRLVLRHVNSAMSRWCEQLGMTGVEPGTRLRDAFPFLGLVVEQEYLKVFATGEPLITQEVSEFGGVTLQTETRKIPLQVDGEVQQVVTIVEDIAPTVDAEKALRSSELRYHAIVESSPMGMHMYTLVDGDRLVFTGANPAADRILGVDHQQFVGKTLEDAFPALAGSGISDQYRQVIRTGGSWKSEMVSYEDDRISGAFEVIAFRSGPYRLTVNFLDITARRRAEAERSRLLAILESTSDMVATANPALEILYINRAGAELLGWTTEELPTKTIADAHPPSELEHMRNVAMPAAIKHGLWSGETTVQRTDGTEIPASQVLMAHRSDEGELAYYSTVIRDLRQIRKVESSLRVQRDLGIALGTCDTLDEVLRLSLVSTISITGMDAGGVYLVDPETDWLNLEVHQDLPEDFVEAVSRLPPDSPSAELVRQGEPLFGHYDQISDQADTAKSPGGLRAFCALPISHGGKTIACVNVTSYCRDAITPFEQHAAAASTTLIGEAIGRKLAEEALRRSEQQLVQAQKMEAVGRLAGGVAHDFNNLLAAIQVTCELMEEEIPAGTQLRADLDQIMETSERGANLVRQLLVFSGRKAALPERVELNRVVESMRKMLRRLIGENIQLHVELSDELGSVEADPGQLDQVLVNLTVNAVEAMPRGGTLTVTTLRRDPPAQLPPEHEPATAYNVLRVQDTGEGMDAETKERIFEPFFSTKESAKGTGLGLAIVYSVASESGGFVGVQSTPGNGSTFELWLPEKSPAKAPDEPLTPTTQARLAVGTESVLVVEDDAVLLRQTARVLEQYGYKVLQAQNGEEAIRLAEAISDPIHLLLSDIVMPDTTGMKLAETLRQTRPELKVLLMSGHIDPVLLEHSLTGPNTTFLPKPFSAETLVTRVRELIDG